MNTDKCYIFACRTLKSSFSGLRVERKREDPNPDIAGPGSWWGRESDDPASACSQLLASQVAACLQVGTLHRLCHFEGVSFTQFIHALATNFHPPPTRST
jgi:hypothetical protein